MATTPYPFVANAILTASQLNSTFNIPVTTKLASAILVAADAGTRVVMNSASATTITVNTSLFSAGDNLQILNIGAGVCTVTAGTCTVGTTGTLALAQNAGGTLTFISASASVFTAGDVAATSFTSTGTTTLTEQSTASTSYVDLSTVTSVTVTTGTTATLWWSGYQGNTGGNVQVYVSFAVSGATTVAASDGNAAFYQTPSSNLGMFIPFSAVRFLTGLTAGSNTFTLKYRVSSGTGQFGQRSLAVIA